MAAKFIVRSSNVYDRQGVLEEVEQKNVSDEARD
jgi:hypothetical protein